MTYPEDFIGKIINGDCLEVMKQMPDKCVDLVLTDPPYQFKSQNSLVGGGFMDFENKKHLTNINESFGIEYNPLDFLNECKRICKVFNGYFFTNKNLLKNYIDFAEMNEFNWELLIWSKPNPIPTMQGHYLFDKEYIIFIRDQGATFNSDLGYQKYFTIIKHKIGDNNEFAHPTQKPLDLVLNAIKISSNENDVILDAYAGSGSFLKASQELKRRFIGIDISEKYCKIAEDRLKQQVLNF